MPSKGPNRGGLSLHVRWKQHHANGGDNDPSCCILMKRSTIVPRGLIAHLCSILPNFSLFGCATHPTIDALSRQGTAMSELQDPDMEKL